MKASLGKKIGKGCFGTGGVDRLVLRSRQIREAIKAREKAAKLEAARRARAEKRDKVGS